MSNRIISRNLLISSLMIPLAFGLAACGGDSYNSERHAQAAYLQDRGEALQERADYLEDAALTSKVAAVITEDRSLQGSDIHIKTFGDTVHLTGYVATPSDAMHAENLALYVRGVRRVDNDLVIR